MDAKNMADKRRVRANCQTAARLRPRMRCSRVTTASYLNLERPGSVTQIVHMRDFKFVLRTLKVPLIDARAAAEISPDFCPKLRIPQEGETDDLIGQS